VALALAEALALPMALALAVALEVAVDIAVCWSAKATGANSRTITAATLNNNSTFFTNYPFPGYTLPTQ
jgi:hypothetical protein